MQEDALGPALAGAEDVAVAETTAGGETGEACEADAAGEDVGHVDVDGREASDGEGEGHLGLAVDTLLAQDGDTRLRHDL